MVEGLTGALALLGGQEQPVRLHDMANSHLKLLETANGARQSNIKKVTMQVFCLAVDDSDIGKT